MADSYLPSAISYQPSAMGHQPKERGDAYWKKQKESFANHEIHKSLNKEEAK